MWKFHKLLRSKHTEYPDWMDIASNSKDGLYHFLRAGKGSSSLIPHQVRPLDDTLHTDEIAYNTVVHSSGAFYGDGWEVSRVETFGDYETDLPTSLEYVGSFSGDAGGYTEILYSLCYADTLSGCFYAAGLSGIYTLEMDGSVIDVYYYNSEEIEEYVDLVGGIHPLQCSPVTGSFELYDIYDLDGNEEATIIDSSIYELSGSYLYMPNISGTYIARYDCRLYDPPLNLKTKNKSWTHYTDGGFQIFGNSSGYNGSKIHINDASLTPTGDRNFAINPFECRPGKPVRICYDYDILHVVDWNSSVSYYAEPVSGEQFYLNATAYSTTPTTSDAIVVYYLDGGLLDSYVTGSVPYYKVDVSGDYNEDSIEVYSLNAGNLELFYWGHREECFDISGGQPSNIYTLPDSDFEEYVMADDVYVPKNIIEVHVADADMRYQVESAPLMKFSAYKDIECCGITEYYGAYYFITDEMVIYDNLSNSYYLIGQPDETVYIIDEDGRILEKKYMHIEYDITTKVLGLTTVGDCLVTAIYDRRLVLIYYNPLTDKRVGYEFQFELLDPKDITIGYDRLYILDRNMIHEIKLRHDYSLYTDGVTYMREDYSRIWKL